MVRPLVVVKTREVDTFFNTIAIFTVITGRFVLCWCVSIPPHAIGMEAAEQRAQEEGDRLSGECK